MWNLLHSVLYIANVAKRYQMVAAQLELVGTSVGRHPEAPRFHQRGEGSRAGRIRCARHEDDTAWGLAQRGANPLQPHHLTQTSYHCTYNAYMKVLVNIYLTHIALLCILGSAVTGLLFVGINFIVVKTVFQGVRGDAGAGPRAELREMLDFKNVMVGGATIEQYEAFPVCNILTQRLVGNSCFLPALRQIVAHRNIDRDWIARENHAGGMQSFVWMPDAEISDSNLVVFIKNACEYIDLQTFCWRFPAIDHLRNDRDRHPVQREGIREGHTDPGSLIDPHRLTHDAGLLKISSESKGRDQYSQIDSPVFLKPIPEPIQTTSRIVFCLFHVVLFSIVGMLLTECFRFNWCKGNMLRSLLFLALIGISALHVVNYLFKLVDAVSITLNP